MKNYTITVNGNVYDVTVEENGAGAPAAAPVAAPRAAAPAAPAAAPKAAAGAGSIQVKAGAAGKVFQVPTSVGQKVEAGDTVIIIEAMKLVTEPGGFTNGIYFKYIGKPRRTDSVHESYIW